MHLGVLVGGQPGLTSEPPLKSQSPFSPGSLLGTLPSFGGVTPPFEGPGGGGQRGLTSEQSPLPQAHPWVQGGSLRLTLGGVLLGGADRPPSEAPPQLTLGRGLCAGGSCRAGGGAAEGPASLQVEVLLSSWLLPLLPSPPKGAGAGPAGLPARPRGCWEL